MSEPKGNFHTSLVKGRDLTPFIGSLNKFRGKLHFVPVKKHSRHHYIDNFQVERKFPEKGVVSELDQLEILSLVKNKNVQNWGLLVSRCKNLFIIDIDKFELTLAKLQKIAELSPEFALKLEKYNQLLSSTYTVKSQSGGRHHYFFYDGIQNYKQEIKKGFSVEAHLGESELIQEYESIYPRTVRKDGKPGDLIVDLDFLNGKQLVLLPHCVLHDEQTDEPLKSYSIYNDVDVKTLTQDEYGTILDFFNGVKRSDEITLKVKRERIKKEKELKVKEVKPEKPKLTLVPPLRPVKYFELTDQELETYNRELNFLNHPKRLKGKPEFGFYVNNHYTFLGDKTLSLSELKSKCTQGRRTLHETSWIRKLFQLGVSKKSIIHFAHLHLNQFTHSYSDPKFIPSFYDRLENGEGYEGLDSDMRECIELVNNYDLKPLFGGSQNSCKKVLEGLYSLGISLHSYTLKYISNGAITLNCRTVLAGKTVRSSMNKLIESGLITVKYVDDSASKKYIMSIRLLNFTQLEHILEESCIQSEDTVIDTYSMDSRLPLHQLKGVGKRGEQLYLIIRKLGGVKRMDIYSLLPLVSKKNRIKEIKKRINLLIEHGFLTQVDDVITVSDKPISDCLEIIEKENRTRDRKLKINPVESQIDDLIFDKKVWNTNNLIDEVLEIERKLESKVSNEEKIKFRKTLIEALPKFNGGSDDYSMEAQLNTSEDEIAYTIMKLLDLCDELEPKLKLAL